MNVCTFSKYHQAVVKLHLVELKDHLISHLIQKISFLTLFGCAVKITLDINPFHIWLDG